MQLLNTVLAGSIALILCEIINYMMFLNNLISSIKLRIFSFFLASKPIVFKVFADAKKSFYSESHWVRFATYNTIVTIGVAIQNLYSTILSYFI